MDHVGAPNEFIDHVAALLGFQIDRDALFAAMGPEQHCQVRAAHRIAVILLNLDYPCAEVRKDAIGEWPRHVKAEVEDHYAVQRPDAPGPAGGSSHRVRAVVTIDADACLTIGAAK